MPRQARSSHVTLTGNADCIHCPIRSQTILAAVSNEALNQVFESIHDLSCAPHSLLYQAGEEGDAIYVIRRGLIKLVQYLPNGSQRIVRLLKPGDIAGLESTVGQTYRQTAVALHKTQVCRIPISAIEHPDMPHSQLCQQFMMLWQKSVEEADHTITELCTGPADARVARLLLHPSLHVENGYFMAIGREDMGSILGITTETASRVIADFKRRGIIMATPSNQRTCRYDNSLLRQIAYS